MDDGTSDLTKAAWLAHRIAALDRQGRGVIGSLTPPGVPGTRNEAATFDFVETARADPLLADLVNVDERALSLECACDSLDFRRFC